jgi:hypothetical protein
LYEPSKKGFTGYRFLHTRSFNHIRSQDVVLSFGAGTVTKLQALFLSSVFPFPTDEKVIPWYKPDALSLEYKLDALWFEQKSYTLLPQQKPEAIMLQDESDGVLSQVQLKLVTA